MLAPGTTRTRCATRIPMNCTCSGSTRATSARTRPRFASPPRSPARGPRPGRRSSRRRGWSRRGAGWSRWTSKRSRPSMRVDGVTVFTVPDGLHVDAGRTLAGVKITPLAIDESSLGAGGARRALGSRRRRNRQRPPVPPASGGGDRAPAADRRRPRALRTIARACEAHGSAAPSNRSGTSTTTAEQVRQALVDAAAYGRHRPRRRRRVRRSTRRHLAEPARRRGDLDPAWPADASGKQLLDRRACWAGRSSGWPRAACSRAGARSTCSSPGSTPGCHSMRRIWRRSATAACSARRPRWRIPPYEAALGDDRRR